MVSERQHQIMDIMLKGQSIELVEFDKTKVNDLFSLIDTTTTYLKRKLAE